MQRLRDEKNFFTGCRSFRSENSNNNNNNNRQRRAAACVLRRRTCSNRNIRHQHQGSCPLKTTILSTGRTTPFCIHNKMTPISRMCINSVSSFFLFFRCSDNNASQIIPCSRYGTICAHMLYPLICLVWLAGDLYRNYKKNILKSIYTQLILHLWWRLEN